VKKTFAGRRSAPALALCGVVALFVMAGCGGSDSTSSAGTGSTGSETTGGESESGGTSIRVALLSAATASLPAEVAQAEGLFKKQGLDVTLETPTIPVSQLPAALGKQFDVIMGTQPDLIASTSKGIDLKAISGLQQNNPKDPGAALIVPEGSSIKSIKDLEGKSVGAPSLVGNNYSSLECWARKEGVDISSIRGLEAPTPQIPELLEGGRFDSALLFEPLMAGLLANGATYLGDAYTECFGAPAQFTSLWISQGSWADENGEAIEKFLAAQEEGVKVMEADPSKARKIYVETSGLPAEPAENTPIIPQEFAFETGQPIVENVEAWVKVLEENGTFQGSVDPASIVWSK
jgi:NitT/TauT family transport system substrate-binding protein